jgi:asparagine synthetase B (glutamine-hydrolysing)
LHIARDRFGAKQIYYYSTPTNFIFASEPKAFLKHKDYSFDINKNGLETHLLNKTHIQ